MRVCKKGGYMVFYTWDGRVDKDQKSKRIHQVVTNVSIEDIEESTSKHIGLVGFASDEGVRRNHGRIGAAEAPDHLRRWMGSLSYQGNKNIIDVGNIPCVDQDLENAQEQLGEYIGKLIEANYTPIILGGGHETFYGHYVGVRRAIGPDKKIGIINIDAHLDMRKDATPSSGTMFRQILEADSHADYFCIGIQRMGNTQELFDTAEHFGVSYVVKEDIHPIELTLQKIDGFSTACDYVLFTICTDVVNQAYAPGVSAPAPFGIDPSTLRTLTERVVQQPNFLSIDVSEVNPSLDVANQTARLMASIIGEVIHHLQSDS